MPLSIAEYLGQRTDVEGVDIIPSTLGGGLIPTCPFSGVACRKLKANPPQHPICSVRMSEGNEKGKPFIVCPDRLIPAKAKALSPVHISVLASVAKLVFPKAKVSDIGFRPQVGVNISPDKLVLDYVLRINPKANYVAGPSKVILEVQGGGETGYTGTITRYVEKWTKMDEPTNEFLSHRLDTTYLRQQTGESKVNPPGIVPNNAWKRQLLQVLKKATLTMHFGGAFALYQFKKISQH